MLLGNTALACIWPFCILISQVKKNSFKYISHIIHIIPLADTSFMAFIDMTWHCLIRLAVHSKEIWTRANHNKKVNKRVPQHSTNAEHWRMPYYTKCPEAHSIFDTVHYVQFGWKLTTILYIYSTFKIVDLIWSLYCSLASHTFRYPFRLVHFEHASYLCLAMFQRHCNIFILGDLCVLKF